MQSPKETNWRSGKHCEVRILNISTAITQRFLAGWSWICMVCLSASIVCLQTCSWRWRLCENILN